MSVATWTYGEFQHFARIASVKAKQGVPFGRRKWVQFQHLMTTPAPASACANADARGA